MQTLSDHDEFLPIWVEMGDIMVGIGGRLAPNGVHLPAETFLDLLSKLLIDEEIRGAVYNMAAPRT